VRVVDLRTGDERAIEVADLLADPARHFGGRRENGDA
jgi:hypothetical protein